MAIPFNVFASKEKKYVRVPSNKDVLVDAEFEDVSIGTEATETNTNTKEENVMNEFAEMFGAMFTAEMAGKGAATKQAVTKAGKSTWATIKAYSVKAYTYIKDLSVSLYSKANTGDLSRTTRRFMKAGLAMASVAVAGTFTTGTLSAALAGMAIFGMTRSVYSLVKGNTAWSWKDMIINTFKDAAYVGLATVGYVYASPFLVDWALTLFVWVLNAHIWVVNQLLAAWSAIGLAIVA